MMGSRAEECEGDSSVLRDIEDTPGTSQEKQSLQPQGVLGVAVRTLSFFPKAKKLGRKAWDLALASVFILKL